MEALEITFKFLGNNPSPLRKWIGCVVGEQELTLTMHPSEKAERFRIVGCECEQHVAGRDETHERYIIEVDYIIRAKKLEVT